MRLKWWLYKLRWRAHWLLTGDCGHVCGMTTFHNLNGTPFQTFVPEAECPVHDIEAFKEKDDG